MTIADTPRISTASKEIHDWQQIAMLLRKKMTALQGEYGMLKLHCAMLHEKNIELEAKATVLSAILLELGSKREKAAPSWDDDTTGGHIRNIPKKLWLRFTGALEILAEQQKGKRNGT